MRASSTRNLYLGYFSRQHADQDPQSASIWEDVHGRSVTLTAVFSNDEEAVAYPYRDKVRLGQVVACIKKGGETHFAPGRTRPLQGPGNATRRI